MKLWTLFMLFVAIQISVMMFDQHVISQPIKIGDVLASNYSTGNLTGGTFYTTANQTDLGTNVSAAENTGIGFSGYSLFPTLKQYTSTSVWSVFDYFTAGLSGNALVMFFVLIILYTFSFGLFASRNEMVYLSPIAMILLLVPVLPIYNVYIIITREIASYGVCPLIGSCWFGSLIGLIIAGPLAFLWLFSVIEFWSARSMA